MRRVVVGFGMCDLYEVGYEVCVRSKGVGDGSAVGRRMRCEGQDNGGVIFSDYGWVGQQHLPNRQRPITTTVYNTT